jgi:hypothetical protein
LPGCARGRYRWCCAWRKSRSGKPRPNQHRHTPPFVNGELDPENQCLDGTLVPASQAQHLPREHRWIDRAGTRVLFFGFNFQECKRRIVPPGFKIKTTPRSKRSHKCVEA